MAELQSIMKTVVKEEVKQVENDKRSLRSSATKEFKIDTDAAILKKV